MKRVFLVKQESTTQKNRFCLNCGANINHKGLNAKFCGPLCKAAYNERQQWENYEKDRAALFPKQTMADDAASFYCTDAIKQRNLDKLKESLANV